MTKTIYIGGPIKHLWVGNRYVQTGEEGYYYTPGVQKKALPQSLLLTTGVAQVNKTATRDYPAQVRL